MDECACVQVGQGATKRGIAAQRLLLRQHLPILLLNLRRALMLIVYEFAVNAITALVGFHVQFGSRSGTLCALEQVSV